MRDYFYDPARTRWVIAHPGDDPLEIRATGWRATREEAEAFIAEAPSDVGLEIVELTGRDAAEKFPLEGEGPRYWEALHPDDRLLGDIAPDIEVYRREGVSEILIIDNTGPGSPELVGTLPTDLGPCPPDPDDEGVAEDDPRWMEMSDVDYAWLQAAEATNLAGKLSALSADAGWYFVEALRAGGYDPLARTRVDALLWIADKAGHLTD
jgi:hypothetical protein